MVAPPLEYAFRLLRAVALKKCMRQSMFAGVEVYRKRPPYSVNNRFLKLSVPAAEAVFFGEVEVHV